MKNLLLTTIIGAFMFGCATPEPEEDFHPTDALLIGGNGGFNPDGTDGGADLGDLDASTGAGEAKDFHPTDALLIGGNGGFNPDGTDGGADLGGYDSEEIPEK
jgi:hypothetical protein